MMLEAKRAQGIVKGEKLEAAHAEHRADLMGHEHFRQHGSARHSAGSIVPLCTGLACHDPIPFLSAACIALTKSRALMPISAPQRRAVSFRWLMKPSS